MKAIYSKTTGLPLPGNYHPRITRSYTCQSVFPGEESEDSEAEDSEDEEDLNPLYQEIVTKMGQELFAVHFVGPGGTNEGALRAGYPMQLLVRGG